MSEVILDNLYKKFGKVNAVDHINLTIGNGELLCLLGPSGCGKTTTLRMIAGLEEPTSGQILFDKKVVNHLEPKERNIAMVFENYALYPHKTVYENIAYPLRISGKRSDDVIKKIVNDMADLLDIRPLINRLPQQLSGGQQQRVGIARALVRKPSVFLLDEPISHLDAKLRAKMRGEIKRLVKDTGYTTILVTHDQLEAMTMGDHIVVMNFGNVLQVGTPNEIFMKPADIFVANFVGEPSMNFLPCTLIVENGNSYLQLEKNRFNLSNDLKNKILENAKEEELIMGIRPQHIVINTGGSESNKEYFEGQVYITEPLGLDQIVHIKSGSNIIRAVTTADLKFEMNDNLLWKFNPNHIYVFNKTTSKAIS